MGTGIVAAIPIIIGPFKDVWHTAINPKNFSENLFDNYDFHEEEGLYYIKTDLLINNYRDFLTEFYTCIGGEGSLENVPNAASYRKFKTVFEHGKCEGEVPYLGTWSNPICCLGGKYEEYWLFCNGSYKANLEEHRTLLHFERLLAKATNNPLVNLVKFGIG
jgi:hypothetical protein